ncbi:uncharacterized protein LOC127245701 [Andrographis paniculata]|uniref:uncharacterized protein LOC127245701 n=1 Tax=Andrographis paniculata TaxID=175694 RepID=UPI0021E78CE9|nr:uncharacterized protein LOC127245701 [Andrographis paniculata]
MTFEGEFVPDLDDIGFDLYKSMVPKTFETFNASYLLLSEVPESPNIFYGMVVPDSDDEYISVAPVGISPKRDGGDSLSGGNSVVVREVVLEFLRIYCPIAMPLPEFSKISPSHCKLFLVVDFG